MHFRHISDIIQSKLITNFKKLMSPFDDKNLVMFQNWFNILVDPYIWLHHFKEGWESEVDFS